MRSPKGRFVCDLASLTGMIGAAGFFSQGAGCTSEHSQDFQLSPCSLLATSTRSPRGCSTHGPTDPGEPLACCQWGNHTVLLGLRAIKQNPSFHLTQIVIVDNLRSCGETSLLSQHFGGELCGRKRGCCVRFNINNRLFLAVSLGGGGFQAGHLS